MGDRLYSTMQHVGRFVRRQCIREFVLHLDRADARDGGFVLAPTHVSHVEPLLLVALLRRRVKWMARAEFFRFRPLGALLRRLDTFSVDRQGVPIAAIRTAIAHAQAGEVVGIFPEGGCRKGRELAFRGGRIKQGACTVAMRARVPIVPVVILGTHAFNELEPWLPGRYGQTWTAFGRPLHPPDPLPSRRDWRRSRRHLARQLEAEYVRTYRELLDAANLRDDMTP